MSAPLISDATLAKIVRILTKSDLSAWEEPCWVVVQRLVDDNLAGALEYTRIYSDDPELIAALEEANEEAARAYDEREAKLDAIVRPRLQRGEWITPEAAALTAAEPVGSVPSKRRRS